MADQAERVILEAKDHVTPVVDKANAGLDSFEKKQNRRTARSFGFQDRLEMFGAIGDIARGGDARTGGAGVNYCGLVFRQKKNWLNLALTSLPRWLAALLTARSPDSKSRL